MKIYYISRKKIISTVVLTAFLTLFIGIGYFYLYSSISVTSTSISEPYFQGNSGKKIVAITVNVDWGEEFIPEMLKHFKEYDANVTFFVTGKWAEKNPETLKEMSKEGHSIQNHGYKHCHFNNLAPVEIKSEIKKAEDIIYEIVGKRSSYFASPYGEYNRQVINSVSEIDYKLIMWSVDTIDWQRPSPDTIVKRVVNKVHNDAIILMHPTEPTIKALPEMLKQLKEEGYKMVTIDKIIIDQTKKIEGKPK